VTQRKQSRQKSNTLQIDDSLLKSATVHTNLTQDVIVTTEDKLMLALIRQGEYIRAKRDWVTPFSVMLAVLASLAAADFKDFANIPAASWKAIFIVIGVSSGIWTLRCGFIALKNSKKGDNQEFINKLKKNISNIENH
jgi:hypothetical protein